jgi:hypothetical protein
MKDLRLRLAIWRISRIFPEQGYFNFMVCKVRDVTRGRVKRGSLEFECNRILIGGVALGFKDLDEVIPFEGGDEAFVVILQAFRTLI